MEIMIGIGTSQGFDDLIGQVLTDMAVGYAGGPIPPDPKWLLEQGLARGYSGDAIDCLQDIVAGNGYLYL